MSAIHIIDCDTPSVPSNWPSGWTVEEHRKDGRYAFNPETIQFYLSESQQNDAPVVGVELRRELTDKPVLNANVLDYLLAHQELIPENWRKDERGRNRTILFWGTIYRNPSGKLAVRELFSFPDGRWTSDPRWIDYEVYPFCPAALRTN